MLSNTILAYISCFNNPANTIENVDLAVYNYRLYIALLYLKGINIYKIEPKPYYILAISSLYL
jgi:hypothetical protein